jgi:hypothetical protein
VSTRTELDDVIRLLAATRELTAAAAGFLALQLFGNLYEQVVTNQTAIATPETGGPVDELAPGSPPFFYLPWAPLGVVLATSLAVRLPRLGAPSWVVRRVRWACGALCVAVAVKVLLITRVNPHFRDPHAEIGELREWAVRWAIGNGAAILAVGAALILLLSGRARLLDDAATLGAAEAT